MLIDTHCHINMMVKKEFDTPLLPAQCIQAEKIIKDALQEQVTAIINVGTSLIESNNCITLAKQFDSFYASIGIHPNDCTKEWRNDINIFKQLLTTENNKIVAIGETGLDKHYPGYNLAMQIDAFKAQIELALEHNLALIVHTRDAGDQTLKILDHYKNEPLRGVIHCFSEDVTFAQDAIGLGFVLGIGGTITYPKNNQLRSIINVLSLDTIILETDAPFLPPQEIRGKQNHPKMIASIAHYIAELRNEPFEIIAQKTSANARRIFRLTA